ncbi:MAG TPA: hypothetical protein VMT18_10545, partial [Planctomycetota bacterium]|nr:hypothetical protein [Planctomycetota bacterium]
MLGALLGAALAGCCGDTTGTLRVHVVDGENGVAIGMPVVIADGETLGCADSSSFQLPVPGEPAEPHAGDGGITVNPPGSDMNVPPPPTQRWCATWTGQIEAGMHTVRVSASGYFTTEVQVDMGAEGGSLSCPDPDDSEITVALYRRPS